MGLSGEKFPGKTHLIYFMVALNFQWIDFSVQVEVQSIFSFIGDISPNKSDIFPKKVTFPPKK